MASFQNRYAAPPTLQEIRLDEKKDNGIYEVRLFPERDYYYFIRGGDCGAALTLGGKTRFVGGQRMSERTGFPSSHVKWISHRA
jgi:hypothetical protein